MKKRLLLFGIFLFIQCHFLSAQKQHWINLEEATYNNIKIELQILHHPNLADQSWLRLVLDNQTDEEVLVKSCSLNVKVIAHKDTDKIAAQGMFQSADFSIMQDSPNFSLFGDASLNVGQNCISKYPSAYCSYILGDPSIDSYNVDIEFYFAIQLEGKTPLSVELDGIQFSFDWFKTETNRYTYLQKRLDKIIASPSYQQNLFYSIKSLLKVEEVTEDIKPSKMIHAVNQYADFPNNKLAFLQFINQKFSKDKVILDYYEAQIQNRNINILNDLKEMPSVWKNEYTEHLLNWFLEGNMGIKMRILDVLFVHQAAWIKNDKISKQMSDELLKEHGHILYALPEQLNEADLSLWSSLATALGKTGDQNAIGILCPFLSSKKRLRSRNLLIDAESLEAPRPTRACDIALEAILHLQGKNTSDVYYKNGFFPPYYNGEAEVIIDRVRDNLIRELYQTDTCQNY